MAIVDENLGHRFATIGPRCHSQAGTTITVNFVYL
jgi:hypothetical protein